METSNTKDNNTPSHNRPLVMLALVVSGETIFLLPFITARIFRPTVLDVFELTNLQLGTVFSVIGTVGMLGYFPGGLLADRFPARRLMATALISTALGGLFYATIPSLTALKMLYAFWGLSTLFLFWAAMIRATREWGGRDSQGSAYGFLDGGRGLTAALLATASVAIFASLLPTDVASATLEERAAALKQIILIFTGLVFGVSLLVWFAIPESNAGDVSETRKRLSLDGIRKVSVLPAVWLQATIVVCAYVGMKSTADFSLYARDAFGYDDVSAARLGTVSFWIRPFAAIGVGFLGDRFGSSRMIIYSFGLVILGSLAIALGTLGHGIYWIIVCAIAGTSVGIYALRGIYFALFEEARIPVKFTGCAIGLVSFIGYTPDIFTGPLFGYLIDRSPGALGHQQVFMIVAAFAAIGLITTIIFQRVTRN